MKLNRLSIRFASLVCASVFANAACADDCLLPGSIYIYLTNNSTNTLFVRSDKVVAGHSLSYEYFAAQNGYKVLPPGGYQGEIIACSKSYQTKYNAKGSVFFSSTGGGSPVAEVQYLGVYDTSSSSLKRKFCQFTPTLAGSCSVSESKGKVKCDCTYTGTSSN